MKLKFILLLVGLLLSNLAFTQIKLTRDYVIIEMNRATNLVSKDSCFSLNKRDSLLKVNRILSNQLMNAKSEPNDIYLKNLNEHIELLKRIKTKNGCNTVVIDSLLSNIIGDLKIKSNYGETIPAKLYEGLTFSVPVKVYTRLWKNGKAKLVNGYKVYANPWIYKNTTPAQIKFTNSTNPYSKENIPPGQYFIWVESLTDPSKTYPLKVESVKIGFTNETEPVTIYIDIIE